MRNSNVNKYRMFLASIILFVAAMLYVVPAQAAYHKEVTLGSTNYVDLDGDGRNETVKIDYKKEDSYTATNGKYITDYDVLFIYINGQESIWNLVNGKNTDLQVRTYISELDNKSKTKQIIINLRNKDDVLDQQMFILKYSNNQLNIITRLYTQKWEDRRIRLSQPNNWYNIHFDNVHALILNTFEPWMFKGLTANGRMIIPTVFGTQSKDQSYYAKIEWEENLNDGKIHWSVNTKYKCDTNYYNKAKSSIRAYKYPRSKDNSLQFTLKKGDKYIASELMGDGKNFYVKIKKIGGNKSGWMIIDQKSFYTDGDPSKLHRR